MSDPIKEKEYALEANAIYAKEVWKEVWNAAIEAAAIYVRENVYYEAQDTDWDGGFNTAREMAVREIRKLKK